MNIIPRDDWAGVRGFLSHVGCRVGRNNGYERRQTGTAAGNSSDTNIMNLSQFDGQVLRYKRAQVWTRKISTQELPAVLV